MYVCMYVAYITPTLRASVREAGKTRFRPIRASLSLRSCARFLSNPFIIRVPFFLVFSFNKGILNQKEQKGTTQEPSVSGDRPILLTQRLQAVEKKPKLNPKS